MNGLPEITYKQTGVGRSAPFDSQIAAFWMRRQRLTTPRRGVFSPRSQRGLASDLTVQGLMSIFRRAKKMSSDEAEDSR
jgi:hypothetical protein